MTLRGQRALGVRPLEAMIAASSGQIPARAADKAEARDVVQMAIQSLNERQRMAVLLSKFEGMSYAEIAESMGLSVQAIKSLLSRARNNLKEVLERTLTEGSPPPRRSDCGRRRTKRIRSAARRIATDRTDWGL